MPAKRMRASTLFARHRAAVLLNLAVVVAWIVLCICLSHAEDRLWWHRWMETATGVNWNSDWETLWKDSPYVFSVTTATVALLNTAVLLITAPSILLAVYSEVRMTMRMTRLEQLNLLAASITPAVVGELRKLYPSLQVSEDQFAALQRAIDVVTADWQRDYEAHGGSTAAER